MGSKVGYKDKDRECGRGRDMVVVPDGRQYQGELCQLGRGSSRPSLSKGHLALFVQTS